MGGFGENLRTEREARGVSLQDISSATKISVRLLQAIENEAFDRLPGGVFNINFVRQYARHLGLEEDRVVNEYRRLTAPANPEAVPPEPAVQRPPILPPEWTARKNAEYEWDRQNRSRAWVIAGVLLLTIAAAGGASLWMADRRNASRHSPSAATSSPMQPPAPQPGASPVPSAPPAPEAPAPGSATSPLRAAEAEAPVRVEIEVSEPVWVMASSDGQIQFQTTLQPQQPRVVTAQNVVRLRVGDAGALAVKLNGQPQPPVGPKGQVRTVILTPKGMQVLTPPPKAESDQQSEPAQPRPSAGQNP